jgi:chorismate mutase
MAKIKQTASERDRTLSGQWTKSEKRAAISRSIAEAKKNTHQILKAFRQQQHMS